MRKGGAKTYFRKSHRVAEALKTPFLASVDAQLAIFENQLAALAHAVEDDHNEKMRKWSKWRREEDKRLRRNIDEKNKKRRERFCPVSVMAVSSDGNYFVRFTKTNYNPETNKAGKKRYELPFRDGNKSYDWRTLRHALEEIPETEIIFKETEAAAANVIALSRKMNHVRRTINDMDEIRLRLVENKPSRQRLTYMKQHGLLPQEPTEQAPDQPQQLAPFKHHISKVRRDL